MNKTLLLAAALDTVMAREARGRAAGAEAREPLRVALCGQPGATLPWLAPHFELTTDPRQADFVLVTARPDCPGALGGKVAYRIVRESVSLGELLDRRGVVLTAER